jgi:serine/threonine-protein phosphatase 2A regulatory subunit A
LTQRIDWSIIIQTIAHAVNGDSLKEVVVPSVSALATDPIPNIRFNVAKSLEQIIPLAKKADINSTLTDVIKPALTKMMEDPDNEVRFYSHRAFALI